MRTSHVWGSKRSVTPWCVAGVILLATPLGGGGMAGNGRPIADATSPPSLEASPDPGTGTLDAIRATLESQCLAVHASLRLDDPLGVVLESVGTVDRMTRIGSFRHVLKRSSGTGIPLRVLARHHDERLVIWREPTTASRDEPSPLWLVATPSELASHGVPQSPELARIARYQPTAAIGLLAGIDPDSIKQHGGTSGQVDVVVDLGAAVIADGRLQAAADAFPVRRLHASVDLGGPFGTIRSVRYHVDIPTGAGGVAHGAAWAVSIVPMASSDGSCPGPECFTSCPPWVELPDERASSESQLLTADTAATTLGSVPP